MLFRSGEESRINVQSAPTQQRAINRTEHPALYWHRQLRGVKTEIVTILHAFDEVGKTGLKGEKISQQQEMIRAAHSAVYPLLWKSILKNNFIFVQPKLITNEFGDTIKLDHITLSFKKEAIDISHDNGGILNFLFKGKEFSHHEVNAQETVEATELYDILTKRKGAWEGIANESEGTFNRIEIANLVKLAPNLTMENRRQILEIGRAHV